MKTKKERTRASALPPPSTEKLEPVHKEDVELCAICQEEINNDSEDREKDGDTTEKTLARLEPCLHMFHRKCYKEWEMTNTHLVHTPCPTCRTPCTRVNRFATGGEGQEVEDVIEKLRERDTMLDQQCSDIKARVKEVEDFISHIQRLIATADDDADLNGYLRRKKQMITLATYLTRKQIWITDARLSIQEEMTRQVEAQTRAKEQMTRQVEAQIRAKEEMTRQVEAQIRAKRMEIMKRRVVLMKLQVENFFLRETTVKKPLIQFCLLVALAAASFQIFTRWALESS